MGSSICHNDILRSTWFTQDDVNRLQCAGINTVRIPVSMVNALS